MLYLHKKQSPARRGRANIALSRRPMVSPGKRKKTLLRDFPQKGKGNPTKFQRKKSLKNGKNQSILASDIKESLIKSARAGGRRFWLSRKF